MELKEDTMNDGGRVERLRALLGVDGAGWEGISGA